MLYVHVPIQSEQHRCGIILSSPFIAVLERRGKPLLGQELRQNRATSQRGQHSSSRCHIAFRFVILHTRISSTRSSSVVPHANMLAPPLSMASISAWLQAVLWNLFGKSLLFATSPCPSLIGPSSFALLPPIAPYGFIGAALGPPDDADGLPLLSGPCCVACCL